MKQDVIGIIGGGNMGEALIKGLHESDSILVSEYNLQRALYLKEKYKITILDIAQLVLRSQVILLAVKPQDMPAVFSHLRQDWSGQEKLIISIAAGLTTKSFEDNVSHPYHPNLRIIRAMPNMPALIAKGMTAICKGRFATDLDMDQADRILSTMGKVLRVQEDAMDAVTAVSGSGPAYVFLFVEQWIRAAITLGFSEPEAKNLVYETLMGSAHLLQESGISASQLRAKVTSKGGTTEAAMDVFLKEDRFGSTLQEALTAARNRAVQLAQ